MSETLQNEVAVLAISKTSILKILKNTVMKPPLTLAAGYAREPAARPPGRATHPAVQHMGAGTEVGGYTDLVTHSREKKGFQGFPADSGDSVLFLSTRDIVRWLEKKSG